MEKPGEMSPKRSRFFQIKEVSLGFSFCLFSVWLHQTATYLVHISTVSFTHKYVRAHACWEGDQKATWRVLFRNCLFKWTSKFSDDKRFYPSEIAPKTFGSFHGLLNPKWVVPRQINVYTLEKEIVKNSHQSTISWLIEIKFKNLKI